MGERRIGSRWIGGLGVIVASLTYLAVAAGAVEIDAGWYRITCKLSGKCVEVQGWSKEDGGNVAQYGYHGGDNQLWRFDPVGGGSYAIISRHSGLCLEVTGWSPGGVDVSNNEGANVRQWEYVGGDNQKWRIESAGGNYVKIVNHYSGMCLDVSHQSKTDGANIYQWGCHGRDNQLWELVSVWRPENGSYVIRSRDSGKCMEVAGWGKTEGSNVVQYDYHGGANQLWVFERIGGSSPDAFRIKNVHNGLYLSAMSSDIGGNVEVWGSSASLIQAWIPLFRNGVYYGIFNLSWCLEVAGSSKGNGANIQQGVFGSAQNTHWTLEIVTPTACSDCTKGAGEEGVDCGGPCPACVPPPPGWQNVDPVRLRGQPNDGFIDVVFLPEDSYKGQWTKFETDVLNAIRDGFLNLGDSTAIPLPADVGDRFNFYIYTGGFATPVIGDDACEKASPPARVCELLPKSNEVLLKELPGADLIVVLRNGYGGMGYGELGPPWAYSGFRVCRSSAQPVSLVMHEVGHALFGLVDEYCGDTTYSERSDGPSNVWKTQAACLAAANQYGWTQGTCMQIGNGADCSVNWWRYDPNNCIMNNSASYFLGEACSERINWVLGSWPDGR